MSISVIIPCYWIDKSLWETTAACLELVEKQLPDGGEIVLVDDGSPWDPAKEPMPVKDPSILRVLRSKENRGYAAACNAGKKHSRRNTLCFLNNDAYVQDGCLSRLLAALKEKPIQIVTAVNDHPIHGLDLATPCGSCWATSLVCWNRLGPLDASFGFGAFEDTDYWFRARKDGVPVVMDREAKIATLGGETIKRHPAHHAQHERNKAEIIRRWGSEHFRL